VINKADKIGADQLSTEICGRLEMDAHIKATDWTPLVVQTVAVEDIGIQELWQAIETHRKALQQSGNFQVKRRERTYQETLRMIHNEIFKTVRECLQESGKLDGAVEEILNRKRDPYTLMRKIVSEWLSIPQLHKEAS
jgi:LAO/AO transport system kinase